MKLGTLIDPQLKDGRLVVVSRDNQRYEEVPQIASHLLQALENWKEVELSLKSVYEKLNTDQSRGKKVDQTHFHSPLPRTYQWADGSAFLHHVRLVRKARQAELPDSLLTTPLLYQGGSDCFLGPYEDIPQIDPSHGTDFEGEVGVIVDDVKMGITPEEALSCIRLLVLINDVSLRGIIVEEIQQGFGFFQGKPSSAFSPFALTPDELGDYWKEGRVHLPLDVEYNGSFFGRAHAGAMHFHFGELIAHAARTRRLTAGTIIGSGTISNEQPERGSSCIVEKRMIEKINNGVITTPFMSVGDTIKIEMKTPQGENLFGTIFQRVSCYK